jgi:hypothetical protein
MTDVLGYNSAIMDTIHILTASTLIKIPHIPPETAGVPWLGGGGLWIAFAVHISKCEHG